MSDPMEDPQQPPPVSFNQACPSCGGDISGLLQQLAQRAQSRISELETQVRILTDKATAAVDKLADYEDQLHQLKSSSSTARNTNSSSIEPPDSDPPPHPLPATANHRSAIQSRLSSLLPTNRRSISQPPSSAPPTKLTHSQTPSSQPQKHHHTTSNPLHPPSSSPPQDLTTALHEERTLRLALEARLSASTTELEELSTQLFSEANELVATERRSLHALQLQYQSLQQEAQGWEKRAQEREREEVRLRERIELLEGREKGKGRRWEELEMRVRRVERVKGLLAESGEDYGRRSFSAPPVEDKGGEKGVDGMAAP